MTSIRNLNAPQSYPRPLSTLARTLVLSRLKHVSQGQLTISEPALGNAPLVVGTPVSGCVNADIHVHDEAFWPQVLFNGSVGAADGYIHQQWSSSDLTSLVRLMVRNRSALNALEGGLALLSAPIRKWLHWRNRNERDQAAQNIRAHYDLGNEFFSHMLDSTMTYSAAVFPNADATLEDAQLNKFKVIGEQLALAPGMHVAEIGSGWGGLAIYLAQQFDCTVTSITLSPAQLEYAQAKAQALGLSDRVTFRLCDYRDLTGQFDRVVSIEMIEAVGAEYLETYVRCISERLKPTGRAVIQMIAIQDQFYEQALASVDFIQHYIFPGSFIPSLTVFQNALTAATDCRIVAVRDIGYDYAKTLRTWRENCAHHRQALVALGYDEAFFRLWDYYLCYCEGGFLERQLCDLQLTLVKPRNTDP